LGVAAAVATGYPLLFPWLPGHRFAVKGVSLTLVPAAGIIALVALGSVPLWGGLALVLFLVSTGIFFGLAYTGNSAVSNYSRVRLEVARFLPVEAVLFALSLALWVGQEVLR
jgi:hypothetical protein